MIDAYRKLVALYPLMMAESLRKLSTGPASYYQIQRRYTSSIAFMSSVGFIVGLGDRHIGNILIDQGTGEAMHVDFALLFNTGEKLNVPEVCIFEACFDYFLIKKVPFRLTRNVVDGFGPIGIEGRFRSVMERSMNFMQQEKTAALTCLKGLLYDPLLEWQSTDDKKKSSDKDLNFRIQLVESRLSGYIHTLLKQKTGKLYG
jgi:phosphatidylinositol kinase/protein kinase (PI-3  family)